MIVKHTLGVDTDTGKVNLGGVAGILNAIPGVIALAVASGTAYEILSSNRRKSLGLANGVIIVTTLLLGIVTAGREQMITAVFIYFLTCVAFKFKFRLSHYALILSAGYVAQFILFPYALYARNIVRTPRFEENVRLASDLMLDVITNPVKYQETFERQSQGYHARFQYYSVPIPTLERFSLLPINAGIIDATLREGITGIETLEVGFEMAVPRFLLPEKTASDNSNLLAHREPGLVGKYDFTTGITIGPVGDAFSTAGWPGTFILSYAITFFLFGAYRFIIDERFIPKHISYWNGF